MAATLIDDERPEEIVSQQQLEDTLEPVEETPEEPQDVEDIPEKYKGKTMKDIIQMHKEAEKLLGRQSSEVGELRKVIDTFIQSQLETPEETDDVDFFENPKEAVRRQIDSHPKVKEAEQMSLQYRQQAAMNEIQRRHPDVYDVVKDQNFLEWVQGSKIRTQLLQQADQGYDVDAGDELLNLWKERQSTVRKTAELEKQSRKQAVKQAATGNVRGSGESSRKVYRRSDIIRLMRDDPERYLTLADEITQAYADGRVK